MAIKLKKTDFVRSLVKNHKLAGHIDQAIGAGEFEWKAEFGPKVGDDGWHPSGDCVPSCADLYAKATGALAGTPGRPLSTSLLKTFQVGHFWHAYIQHIVVEKLDFADWEHIERRGTKGWGDKLMRPHFGAHGGSTQFFYKPFHYATGSADIAPCHVPGTGEFLVDIKTMGSFDFKQMGLPAWCAPKYECQVNVYMDWFDLDQTVILCVSKDSPHEFKEFLFTRNQPLIDAIYDKWKLVGKCIEEGVEPDPDYEITLPLVGPKL